MKKPVFDVRLGLTKNESLLLGAITVAPLGVSAIARATHIPRTSLLYMLRTLEKRTLVTKVMNGKRSAWRSTIGQTNTEKTESVVVRKGLPAILDIFALRKDLPKNTRIIGFQPDKSMQKSLKKNTADAWEQCGKWASKNKLLFECVVHECSANVIPYIVGKKNALRVYTSFTNRIEDYVKLPDGYADVGAEFYIFKKNAYIINWEKELAIEISDPSMVDLLTLLFKSLKEQGQRYQQGKKMAKEKIRLETEG